MFKNRLDWNSSGFLFEEQEGRERKDLTETTSIKKEVWHELREDKTADVSALLPPPSTTKKTSPDEFVF